jgi:hypothetical protein
MSGCDVVRSDKSGSGCCEPYWDRAGEDGGSDVCCCGGDFMKSENLSV